MTKHEPVPVTFKDGSSWEIKLNSRETISLMLQVMYHDFRGICNRVVPSLGLDVATRRRMENLPNVTKRHVHQYRIINKAMAMELLSASLLACLNKPKEVRSWCVHKRNGAPNYFSPPLHADVTARYFNDENNKPYRVIAEVSAKKAVTKAFMRKQISQAWNHARVEALNRDEGPVYALVINGGKIGSDPKIWEVFHDFVKENPIEPNGIVRLLPLYAVDVVAVVRRIEDKRPAGGLQFESGLLARIFDELIKAISGEFMHGDTDPDWMCKMFVDMVLADANEIRSHDDDPDRHEPAGKAPGASRRHRRPKARWRPYEGEQKAIRLKKQPLVLVTLDPEEVLRAKEVNGKRKRITHALICGQYGRIFGTEKHCLKCYTVWSGIFSSLFSKPLRTSSYAIDNFTSSFNLETRLRDANKR